MDMSVAKTSNFRDRGGQPYRRNSQENPGSHSIQTTIAEETLSIGKKQFMVTKRSNPKGDFLRIVELSNGFTSNIIVPLEGWEAFKQMADRIAGASLPQPTRQSSRSSRK